MLALRTLREEKGKTVGSRESERGSDSQGNVKGVRKRPRWEHGGREREKRDGKGGKKAGEFAKSRQESNEEKEYKVRDVREEEKE